MAYYGKVADKYRQDKAYPERELARIGKMLGGAGLSRASQDSFVVRRNILNRVVAIIAGKALDGDEASSGGKDL